MGRLAGYTVSPETRAKIGRKTSEAMAKRFPVENRRNVGPPKKRGAKPYTLEQREAAKVRKRWREKLGRCGKTVKEVEGENHTKWSAKNVSGN